MTDEPLSVAQVEAVLDRLLGWVRAAESRLALVLPLSTAMLGTLAVLMPSVSDWTLAGGITSAFAAFFLLLSIVFAACASFPRTTGPPESLVYFGGIVTRDLRQYAEAVKSASQRTHLEDILVQCHRNAQIAHTKYAWVQRSMACLFLAAIPWGLALVILYSGTP